MFEVLDPVEHPQIRPLSGLVARDRRSSDRQMYQPPLGENFYVERQSPDWQFEQGNL